MDADWFKLEDVIRKRFAKQVWIPLRLWRCTREGEYGCVGYKEDLVATRSVAIHQDYRSIGEKVSWQDSLDGNGFYSTDEYYARCEDYQYRSGENAGVFLCLSQNCSGLEPEHWYLNQDLEIAFGLLREGDDWVCPQEGYDTVVRLEKTEGKPTALLIKAQYLKEYLFVRKMSLRLTSYSSRTAVADESFCSGWTVPLREIKSQGRFEGREWPIHPGGHPFGAKTGVFHISRNDLDFDDDVPELGPETNENTEGESWTIGSDEGTKLKMIQGEFWRDDWIEPAERSSILRYGGAPSSTSFIVDSAGTRQTADQLNNEDVGKWLWFRPTLVNDLLSRRNTRLTWHTADTATIHQNGRQIHFGINIKYLVTVYAYDIARLSEWQRIICQGHNVPPDGKVSAELLAAQVSAKPAGTRAPEAFIKMAMQRLDEFYASKHGNAIFAHHVMFDEILTNIHRFRATDQASVLSLAKDLARLTADRIDKKGLQQHFESSEKQKLGSLKILEAYISLLTCPEESRNIVGPLFGVYELRLADAHLPSSNYSEFYRLAGVNSTDPFLKQGRDLIKTTVDTLWAIGNIVGGIKRE